MASYFLKGILLYSFVLFSFSGLGGFLVYDAIRNSGPLQLTEVISGAILVALGLGALNPQVRLALRWIEIARAQHDRDA